MDDQDTTLVVCPICGQAGQVEKVSAIYLKGIELKLPSQRARQQDAAGAPFAKSGTLAGMPPADLRELSKRLSPPASQREAPTRPLHPDLVVLVFSLAAPIFLYGIITSQSMLLPLVLLVLAGFYGFYFWKRKTMVARFEAQQFARRAAMERILRGIERWMRLYYCSQDDGVFEPGSDEFIPADQISGYLLRD